MSVIEKLALAALLLFLAAALARLLRSPLKLALRVLVNAALGFAAMWLLNLAAPVTGLSLGLSWFNGLTVGILGVPGFCLLLVLQWVLR